MLSKRQFLLSAICSTFLLFGCGQKSGEQAAQSGASDAASAAAAASGDTIKVGVLHSLSGTMAISETSLKTSLAKIS